MIEKLDKKQQRQLAIGILAGAVVAVLAITAGPVWMANASRQVALDDAHERLQRYQQIAARDTELLPQYEALLQKQRSAGNHLRSETSAVAGAELQRLVKTITGEEPGADREHAVAAGFRGTGLPARSAQGAPARHSCRRSCSRSTTSRRTTSTCSSTSLALRDNMVGRTKPQSPPDGCRVRTRRLHAGDVMMKRFSLSRPTQLLIAANLVLAAWSYWPSSCFRRSRLRTAADATADDLRNAAGIRRHYARRAFRIASSWT